MKKEIYKVQLSQYVREFKDIYVEADSVDDAAITAIEAMGWIKLDWERDKHSFAKSGSPIVMGPVAEAVSEEFIYKRKK